MAPSTRQTQPYRAVAGRRQGPALDAMTRGHGPLPELAPGNVRRRALKKRRRRKGRARYSSPLQRVLAQRRQLGRVRPGARQVAGNHPGR